MRALRIGVVAAIVVVAGIGALRIAGLITAAQMPWLTQRALALTALLLLAALAIGVVSGRASAQGSPDRPIP